MKAMLLAVGRRSRLKLLTNTIPKPLITIQGKPLIIWHIEALARAHITELIINCFWLSQVLKSYLKNGQAWGVNIHYSEETVRLGTGGGIKKALPLLGYQEPFLLISSDITTNYPLDQLAKKKIPTQRLGHIVCIHNLSYHAQGDYGLHQTFVQLKSPTRESFTFASIALIKPTLFEHISDDIFPITVPFDQAIHKKNYQERFSQGIIVMSTSQNDSNKRDKIEILDSLRVI
ncbi:MAG: NTP transferase domain-containing protein [Endozoicomonadaceae bacterium]|nr:NTP transferase domain-containing protein [Endozoicomonadaceae bacterium]